MKLIQDLKDIKIALWEKDGTERLKFLFDKYAIDLLNASSLDYDLKIRPKVLRGRTKPVPVFFKNKTADLNAIFVKGCEVRMKDRERFRADHHLRQ